MIKGTCQPKRSSFSNQPTECAALSPKLPDCRFSLEGKRSGQSSSARLHVICYLHVWTTCLPFHCLFPAVASLVFFGLARKLLLLSWSLDPPNPLHFQ